MENTDIEEIAKTMCEILELEYIEHYIELEEQEEVHIIKNFRKVAYRYIQCLNIEVYYTDGLYCKTDKLYKINVEPEIEGLIVLDSLSNDKQYHSELADGLCEVYIVNALAYMLSSKECEIV